MTERRKVMVVLANAEFLRNFVESGVLGSLHENYEVEIAARDQLREHRVRLADDPRFVGWFRGDPAVESRHFFLFNVLMWRHRRRAGAFLFRARRTLGFEYLTLLWRGTGPWGRGWAFRRFVREILVRKSVWAMLVLGTPPCTAWFVRRMARSLPVNPELRAIVSDRQPDLLVFPSSAYDAVGNDVARIGTQLGVPTLFLIDNWDNLSSKSIFWAKPDHVGVWGPQTREHAEHLQGFPPERVHELGTPRFDDYLGARTRATRPPVPERYVLFVGCSLPFDEISPLRELDEEIERHPELYEGITVVYRPHPSAARRFTDASFDEASYRHVVLDPQLRTLAPEDRALPPLEHYGPLLKHCTALVGPLTTMVVEGLLFNRPVLALAYDDGVHYTSPSRALRSYDHFRGIERIDQLRLCRDRAELVRQFREVVTRPSDVPQAQTDAQLSWFLCFGDEGYGRRLADTIAAVLRADERVAEAGRR